MELYHNDEKETYTAACWAPPSQAGDLSRNVASECFFAFGAFFGTKNESVQCFRRFHICNHKYINSFMCFLWETVSFSRPGWCWAAPAAGCSVGRHLLSFCARQRPPEGRDMTLKSRGQVLLGRKLTLVTPGFFEQRRFNADLRN